MIRKQVYLEPRQEAKLKRLAHSTGKTEAELIREALDRLPESDEPIQARLRAAGLLLKVPRADPERVRAAEIEYFRLLDGRRVGLTDAIAEERAGNR